MVRATTGPDVPRLRWGVVLAGGNGKRLLPLTRKLTGDERPKQFCILHGKTTLLEQTLERIDGVVSPEKTIVVLTREHERFFRERSLGLSPSQLLVQPSNMGTTPAILYSLMRIHALDASGRVAFFPSDHYVSNQRSFSSQVQLAFALADLHPDRVILLGIRPEMPEVSYGWIEPGDPFEAAISDSFSVTRFWEKPSRAQATDLFRRRCLWNSFIMVGTTAAFIAMVRRTLPDLHNLFESIQHLLLSELEQDALSGLYQRLSPSSFSSDVLAANTDALVVLRSAGFRWSDLGDPTRVLKLYERKGVKSEDECCLLQKLTA